MHANNREDIKEAPRRRHRRAGRPEEHDDRRHAVRSRQADRARAHGVPRPGHRGRGRAEDQGRPGEDGRRRWRGSRRRTRPSASRPTTRCGQTIIKGMGELHLEIIVDSLKRDFKVEANVGAPQVAYRETITQAAEHRLHAQEADRRLGPVRAHQAALRAAAAGRRATSSRTTSSAARCRRNTCPGVEKGLEASRNTGVLAGFPVIDFKVTLIDGAYHDVDSSALAFEIAARAAFQEGIAEGRPEAARADHEGRGGDARGLHGRRHRRPEQPARPDHRHGQPRQRARHRLRWCRSPTCSATSTPCAR